ncbi:MAG: MaoC family dehydratase N-terminal domain-containing protein [Chloroflexi bacterium]|nr:MaoC family dehydratase N-terminal domain-containing protein [Chloroflexota bacterium]
MRAAIGRDSEPKTYLVEAGAIRRFADAIGDPSLLYRDERAARKSSYGGIVAPPTFLRLFRPSPAIPEFPNPLSSVLDGGSRWEYFEPVRPGDRITVTIRLVDLYERAGSLGNMLFAVRENRFVNQSNALVAVDRDTEIYYDAATKEVEHDG